MGLMPSFSPARFRAPGVHFTGSDYLTTTLTGIVDGTDGVFSCWLKMLAAQDATQLDVFYMGDNSSNARLNIARLSNKGWVTAGWGTGATPTRRLFCDLLANSVPGSTTWRHVLISWSCIGNSPSPHVLMYLDDVEVSAAGLLSTYGTGSGNIFYSDQPTMIGANSAFPGTASERFIGDMAELYFDTTYYDLSVTATRRKWRDSNGKPVFLGMDGSGPSGAQPLVYMTGKAASWPNNRGSGGAFTLGAGSITDATTSPSD